VVQKSPEVRPSPIPRSRLRYNYPPLPRPVTDVPTARWETHLPQTAGVAPAPVGAQRSEDATGGVDAAMAWVKSCVMQVPSPLDGGAVAGHRGVRAREVQLRLCLALSRSLVSSFLIEVQIVIERLREVAKAAPENHVWRAGVGI
jgi:hypothetical protein